MRSICKIVAVPRIDWSVPMYDNFDSDSVVMKSGSRIYSGELVHVPGGILSTTAAGERSKR